MAKTNKPITRDDLKKRMQDEVQGIRPGATRNLPGGDPVDFGSKRGSNREREPDPPPPDLSELGLPLALRKVITADVLDYVEYGKVEKEAAAAKAVVSKRLKEHTREHAGVASFMVQNVKVTVFSQSRESFNHVLARALLIEAGVKVQVIDRAFEQALSTTSFDTLRVTPPREEV